MEAHKVIAERIIAVLGVVTFLMLAFAPTAHAQSGNVYASNQVQRASTDDIAIVLQVAIKKTEASGTARMAGAGIGGLLGGMAGNNMDYQSRFAANALGALVGGIVGERTANAVMSGEAQEITLGFSDPGSKNLRIVTVVQPEPFDAVAPDDVVIVSNMNGNVRVRKLNVNTAQVRR